MYNGCVALVTDILVVGQIYCCGVSNVMVCCYCCSTLDTVGIAASFYYSSYGVTQCNCLLQ